MEPHTPKREAIERFLGHETGVAAKTWVIRVKDEEHDPVILLQAWRDDAVERAPEKF